MSETASSRRRAQANTEAPRPRPKQMSLYLTRDEHRFLAQSRVDTDISSNTLLRAAINLMREDQTLLRRVVARADSIEPAS